LNRFEFQNTRIHGRVRKFLFSIVLSSVCIQEALMITALLYYVEMCKL